MKKISRLILLVVAISLVFTACQKETLNQAEAETKVKPSKPQKMLVDDKQDMQEYKLLLDANTKRLEQANRGLSQQACMSSIQVPKDYATIQAAADAACPNADILVSPGTYNEIVVLTKPGLHVKAIGNVIVNGGFLLSPDADNAKIQQFTIKAGVPFGIRTYAIAGDGLSGVQVIQNTIPSNPSIVFRGILLQNSNNCSIRDNSIDNASWGIIMAGVCQNNAILDNKILNINQASAIHLQGDCDYNVLSGNIIKDKTGGGNAGITLASVDNISACDNNVVRNNISSNGAMLGLWEWGPGSQNTIGPNNQINNNGFAGILIGFSFNSIFYGLGPNNHIFNNDVLNNGVCDILDAGKATNNNTYKNNNYGCFSDTF